MSLASNIVRRPSGRYYARIAIPLDLQTVLNRKEIWRSLNTSDPVQAKRNVAAVVAGWRDQFDELQSRRAATPEDLQAGAWRHYESQGERDRIERAALPKRSEIDLGRDKLEVSFAANPPATGLEALDRGLDYIVMRDAAATSRDFRRIREATLRKHLAEGETALIHHAADEVIRREGLLIVAGSPQYLDLCQKLQRAELEDLKRATERDRGDWTGTSGDLAIQPLSGPQLKTAPPGESILELFERYAAENSEGVTKDTIDQSRMAVKLFAQIVGEKAPAAAITRQAASQWKTLMLSYPVRASETVIFKGLKLREIVKANEKAKKPVISRKTVNRYLSGLGAFSTWLVSNDLLTANPVTGMFLKIDKTRITTRSFTTEQLNALFKSPLFVGCRSDTKFHLPGNHQIRDYRFWIPHLMLWSGARPGELAQMLVADVKKLHGQWVLHISHEGDETKRIKTRGSVRIVPVHSQLVKLGFLDLVEKMRKKGSQRLFPEVERSPRGQMGSAFGRDFSRLLTLLKIKDGRGYSLYSFRHATADALRRAEYLDETFGYILGHGKSTTTGLYGQIPQGMLRQESK